MVLWKTVWQLFKRLTIEILYDTATLLLPLYPTEIKTCSHKILYMNIHSSIIHNSETAETIQVIINR